MAVCYNKLWKILIDRGMSKTQLIKAAQISTNAMAKLGKNEDVRVEVLVRIYKKWFSKNFLLEKTLLQ